MKQRIGFIGFGNMARALADGLLRSGAVTGAQMYACAKHWEKLCENTGIRKMNACKTVADTAMKSDILFLAVKPYQVAEVLSKMKELWYGKTVISLAAGMLFDAYEKLLPPQIHHLSIIPNIPVSVCEGVILWEMRNSLNEAEAETVEQLLSGVAMIEKLDSSQMTIGATVTGCGPAFTAMFIEAMGDGALMYGLSRETGYRLCEQMMAGTAKQLIATKQHPSVMKGSVSSPKGTTIQGIAELERLGFRHALISAIERIEQFRST